MQLNCGYLTIEVYVVNLICQYYASLFDGKFDSGHIL